MGRVGVWIRVFDMVELLRQPQRPAQMVLDEDKSTRNKCKARKCYKEIITKTLLVTLPRPPQRTLT